MPIYEYVCKDCDKPFEKLLLNTKEKVTCPSCGGSCHVLQLSVVATPAKFNSTPSYCETGGSTRPDSGGCGNCGCD